MKKIKKILKRIGLPLKKINPLKIIKSIWFFWKRASAGYKFEIIRDSAIIISSIAVVFSVIIAVKSLNRSADLSNNLLNISKIIEKIQEDYRQVEKLDLEPDISFKAQFKENEDLNHPHAFLISNWGPIEAVQLEIQLIYYIYNDLDKTLTVIPREEWHWTIDSLSPFDENEYFVSGRFLNQLSECQALLGQDILEARIAYRRDPDGKLFIKRAFYFINDEGLWITEKKALEKDENFYSMIIDKLFKFDIVPNKPSDILHRLDKYK